jgi:hypothetical protein
VVARGLSAGLQAHDLISDMPSVDFEVGEVFVEVGGREPFVAARRSDLPESGFVMREGATLGDCRIEPWFDSPRKIDSEGKQRMDVFVFKL